MSNDLEKWLNKKESSKELITDSLIQKFEACLSEEVDLSNYFEDIKQFEYEKIKLAQLEYIERLKSHQFKEKIITDKAPLNFFYIGFILKFLPNSKFINVVRNPIDNCWSLYKNHFPTKIDFANDLHISQDKIKEYIHNWPDEIYEIIIMLQKTPSLKHYIYHLPNGDGVLEFNLNDKRFERVVMD